jgi:hypothetical protein
MQIRKPPPTSWHGRRTHRPTSTSPNADRSADRSLRVCAKRILMHCTQGEVVNGYELLREVRSDFHETCLPIEVRRCNVVCQSERFKRCSRSQLPAAAIPAAEARQCRRLQPARKQLELLGCRHPPQRAPRPVPRDRVRAAHPAQEARVAQPVPRRSRQRQEPARAVPPSRAQRVKRLQR